jgi:DNA-binding FadR family transcriptional regulator
MLSGSLTSPFTAVTRGNAADAVCAQLLNYLASGEVSIGDRLPPEHALAQALEVSRPVVREALGMLRARGLVESRSGRGTNVIALSPESAPLMLLGAYSSDDLYEVRRHLEVPGVALAAKRHTAGDARRLKSNLDAQRACADMSDWAALDIAFHKLLAEAAHNPIHSRLVATLADLHHEQSAKVLALSERRHRSLNEHAAIFAAIAASDEKLAVEAMEAHLAITRAETHVLSASAAAVPILELAKERTA